MRTISVAIVAIFTGSASAESKSSPEDWRCERHPPCWRQRPMRRLEARYHWPVSRLDGYIVVGYVIWQPGGDEAPPRVEPAPSLTLASAPVTLLATLKHLVLKTAPMSFERLRSLRSRHWSFVSVDHTGPDQQTLGVSE
jgi:hypothetical protein